MVSIYLLSLGFSLNHTQYITLLPKSITTAIGMGVSEKMGGIVTLTVVAICVTGITGNVAAEAVLKLFRIKEPIARGLAIGTSSHALGTAKAMELGEIEGAMSSLAIVVTGILTVVSVSVFANFI
jgi:putative effector of murein hydrolase